MPHTVPACPQCGLENTYPDGSNYVCPDCAFEWPQVADAADADADAGDVDFAIRGRTGLPDGEAREREGGGGERGGLEEGAAIGV